MRKKLISTLIIILFCFPALASVPKDSLKITLELNDFIKQYVDATNSHNFDNVQPLVLKEAVYWFNKEESRGIVTIRANFEKSWNYLPDEIYGIEKVEWLAVTPNTAACRYEYTFCGTHDGVRVEGRGFGTSVLVKQDGKWLITHEHLSR